MIGMIDNSCRAINKWIPFNNCQSLQSVTIPDSVTNIDNRAFYGCESLQSIFISRKTYDRLKFKLKDFSSEIKLTD